MLFIGQHILDDYLQHVFARRKVRAELNSAASNQPFLINYVRKS